MVRYKDPPLKVRINCWIQQRISGFFNLNKRNIIIVYSGDAFINNIIRNCRIIGRLLKIISCVLISLQAIPLFSHYFCSAKQISGIDLFRRGCFSNSSVQMEWSLGECAIDAYLENEIILSQGFHQPFVAKSTERITWSPFIRIRMI